MRPVYSGGEAKTLDINPIYIGRDFGPMRITPEEAEDISGRTYAAGVYGSSGKLADFIVTKIDQALGIIEISMTKTETAKLTAGVHKWEVSYQEGTESRLDWSGNISAQVR